MSDTTIHIITSMTVILNSLSIINLSFAVKRINER